MGSIIPNNELRIYHSGLMFNAGYRYFLNKSTYIYLLNELEFRKCASPWGLILDYQRVFSEMLNFGFGFSIN